MPPFSRRSFLQHATLTGMTLPLASFTRVGRAAANDKLRLAGIGVGGMGGADLASLSSHPGVEVVALCDVDSGNLAAAGEIHKGAKKFADFRKMFDEFAGSIDAVHVSTPDHTHAPAAMTALNHGKHVYCQKHTTSTNRVNSAPSPQPIRPSSPRWGRRSIPTPSTAPP
jgi:hypothetical protein